MRIQPYMPSSSVYDYSDPSIRQTWIAALCYLAASLPGAILAAPPESPTDRWHSLGKPLWSKFATRFGQREAALPPLVVGLIVQAVIVLPLAFGIYKERAGCPSC